MLNADMAPDFRYIDYAFGLHMISRQEQAMSFPWRRTVERAEQVLFTRSFMQLENAFHYKLRATTDASQRRDLNAARVGRVATYSFGGEVARTLDRAAAESRLTEFPTELVALTALLTDEIDLLLLPKRVVGAIMRSSFPDEADLLRTLPTPMEVYPLHAIAPDTPWGREQVARFDASYEELLAAGVVSEDYVARSLQRAPRRDVSILTSAEGFPVITGTLRSDLTQEFAVPPGTRVLVLAWSPRILEATGDEPPFRTMTDRTAVLVLNGPHLGKELLIKNMHIVIAE